MEIWEFIGEEGWLIQGIALDVPGHDIQIIRYDEDNEQFMVKLDNRIEQMPSDEVFSYILNHV